MKRHTIRSSTNTSNRTPLNHKVIFLPQFSCIYQKKAVILQRNKSSNSGEKNTCAPRITMLNKVVLDTNCLLMALSRHNEYYPVWRVTKTKFIYTVKKTYTLFIALLVSVETLFASNTSVGGIWYDFDSSSQTASVTYHGASYSSYINDYTGAVVIPATITYNGIVFRVTSIGKNAFRACEGLTSISIASSVESIGENAFRGCNELISIVIPNSVASIGDSTFYNSHLKSVTIGDSVASIGNRAFALSY